MGSAGLSGAAKTRRGPAVSVEHRQVCPRLVASESEPRAGDCAAAALGRRARPAKPSRGLIQSLNPPNRRIRDPYVRWCGSCALQAQNVQSSEMATLTKPSQQSGTESCVGYGNVPGEA